MSTEENLRHWTSEFFRCYWNLDNGLAPVWSNHWDYNCEIPNQNKRGCYALFNKYKEVIYIGVGIGKSFGQYHGSGLGDRLKRYWKVDKDSNSDKKYKTTEEWIDVASIITIGFEEIHYPLAAALEIYLINKLNPPRNSRHIEKIAQ